MKLSKTLVSWYLQNKRDLPWRETTNPYYIWLSEIILQQTRVDQGLVYYLKFVKNLIKKLKEAGKTIAGFGAPTKATTLMAQFGLGKKELDFIVDDNPLKQGLYTPGTHVPVLSADAIYKFKPDYLLILAWNFAEPIMKNHNRYMKEGGKFILPMPNPEIVE